MRFFLWRKRMRPLLLFGILAVASAFGQPLPSSATAIDAGNLTESFIASNVHAVSPDDVKTAQDVVRRSQQESSANVARCEASLSALRTTKQTILRYQDEEAQQQEQIRLKEQSLMKAREEALRNLQQVAFKGIFAVEMPAGPMDAKPDLEARALAIVSPKAIRSLRGVFLHSTSETSHSQLRKDLIHAESSGELNQEQLFLSQTFRQSKKYLFLVKVRVRPLADGKVQTESVSTSGAEVVDLSFGFSASALRDKGLDEDEIKRLHDAWPEGEESIVATENATSRNLEAATLESGQRLVRQIENDIATARQNLDEVKKQLKAFLAGLGTRFDEANPGGSINEALASLDRSIALEQSRKIAAKEQELQALWGKIAPSHRKIREDIAKTTMGIVEQLRQGYGKVEQITKVENSQLQSDENAGWSDWMRDIDRIWVLPVPTDSNDFMVSVVVHFKMHKGVGQSEVQGQTSSRSEITEIAASGRFTDSRNGQIYRTVRIGNQTWMAENLNYRTGNSWCYGNNASNCQKYGRLYDWQTARCACPSGWHLASGEEWRILSRDDDQDNWASSEPLKARSWDGTDAYGFNALPAGFRYIDGNFMYAGNDTFGNVFGDAHFWSSSEFDARSAWFRVLDSGSNAVVGNKMLGLSVRCLKD